jgi:hypothetical protein
MISQQADHFSEQTDIVVESREPEAWGRRNKECRIKI